MNKQGPNKIDYLRGGYTWGPISGCLHGCSYCYMERMAKRFPDQISMVPAMHYDRLEEPLRIKKPARIGVTFNGDMWGEWVQKAWIEYVLETCRQASWHRFLFLTKNPARYAEFEIPENCWCGTSTTGSLDESFTRVMFLYGAAPVGRRFVSLEPYVGRPDGVWGLDSSSLNWLIVGGLTGPGAQKPPAAEIKIMALQCTKKNIPLFVKSNAGTGPQEYPEGLK
jgi:protein gp37